LLFQENRVDFVSSSECNTLPYFLTKTFYVLITKNKSSIFGKCKDPYKTNTPQAEGHIPVQ